MGHLASVPEWIKDLTVTVCENQDYSAHTERRCQLVCLLHPAALSSNQKKRSPYQRGAHRSLPPTASATSSLPYLLLDNTSAIKTLGEDKQNKQLTAATVTKLFERIFSKRYQDNAMWNHLSFVHRVGLSTDYTIVNLQGCMFWKKTSNMRNTSQKRTLRLHTCAGV